MTHSTTKYMDGHGMCVGGAIVDSGNFDWTAYPDKFPGLCAPDESYHGVVYTEKFGKAAYITKATSQLMRDLGSIQSPMNAFLLNVGLETLHLRVPRHCENALKVAQYLEGHEKVAWVNYPGLKSSKYYELAQKYMPGGTCGVISFGLKGGRKAAEEMMDRLKLAAIVTHVADARTCVLHPASHTHRQMNDEQLKEAGVAPDLIRLSVGIENVEDILADLAEEYGSDARPIIVRAGLVGTSAVLDGYVARADAQIIHDGDTQDASAVAEGPGAETAEENALIKASCIVAGMLLKRI